MSTATLNIEKNKTLVPQLRFQEFDKEWELNKLGDITSWASGGTPPKDNPLFWEGDIPWISASSMRGIVYSNSELRITSAGLKKGSKLAKKGSLLILVRGSMLFNKIPIGIVSKDVSFNQDVKSIVIDNSYSTSEFILNWFTAFEPKILNMVTGTGIGAGKLDLPDLKALKISLPTLPEQQKIASFLSAVDEKIQQLSRKKELLEQYKKGLMQQLFSGKLRFKDENGDDYADWEEKKLGEVMKIPEKMKPKYFDVNKLLTVRLHTKGLIKNKNTESLKLGATNYFVRKKGQFIYGKQNLFNGAFDIIPDKFDGFYSSSDIPSIDFINNKVIPEFVLFYLSRKNYYDKLENLASGSGSKRIHENTFLEIEINFPSLEEQQKIANFLSSIDAKIESNNQQINQTQSFKKGLLQQLFV